MKSFVALGFLAFIITVECGVSIDDPFYCYSTDPTRPQNRQHSTLTSYETVRRSDVNLLVSSCTPSRFWFLSRHGGRLPAAALLQRMINFADSPIQSTIARNYDEGRTTLCFQDYTFLRDWVRDPNITIEVESLNTVAGWNSMQNIGRRYQQLFPNVLQTTYSQQRYLFRHADTQRSRASISAFASGIFGSWDEVTFEPVPEQDIFLRPIHFCPQFTAAVALQPQQEAFAIRPEIRNMIAQVNRRLGLRGSEQLSFDDILLAWEWCRFETGSSDGLQSAAWCIPFSAEHHVVLEYYRDIGYYHFTGYGVPNQRLIQNLNCGLMKDMLTLMQSYNANDRPVRIYSSFSQIVQAFLVTLGAFRDENPLNEFNFAIHSNRHWKTSFLTPNAAHLAIIRYDCASGDHELQFLLNERPFLVPGCQPNGLCKLSFILNQFQRFMSANCESLFCSSN